LKVLKRASRSSQEVLKPENTGESGPSYEFVPFRVDDQNVTFRHCRCGLVVESKKGKFAYYRCTG
jgi:hypothetical protein